MATQTITPLNGQKKGHNALTTSIPEVPVTRIYEPFVSTPKHPLEHAGTARANYAPDTEHPEGSTKDNWRTKHSRQTVIQQHVDYFDPDKDGIIWPLDTYLGFAGLGFNFVLCVFAMLIIHGAFSYPTSPWFPFLPDPFFRVYMARLHKCKHGSDTGTYDTEGRYIPQKFEDWWSKYGKMYGGEIGVSKRDVYNAVREGMCVADAFGWTAESLEWTATYIALWPDDGILRKEEVRGIYDGSIFETLRKKQEQKKKSRSKIE